MAMALSATQKTVWPKDPYLSRRTTKQETCRFRCLGSHQGSRFVRLVRFVRFSPRPRQAVVEERPDRLYLTRKLPPASSRLKSVRSCPLLSARVCVRSTSKLEIWTFSPKRMFPPRKREFIKFTCLGPIPRGRDVGFVHTW